MKKKEIIVAFLILIIGISIIFSTLKKDDLSIENKNVSSIDTYIDTDDGDEDIDWSNYDEIATLESYRITESGTYNLTGNINGTITINTTGNVKLVLDNVNIKSNTGPAIIIEEAENVVIHLNEGTNNILEDSSNYSFDDEDINGVIYSKDDLIFEGTGSLTIKSNYQDGIVSKDDLKIISGTYNINSLDDGIRGKDSVYIKNGNFNIESGADGIKSTNDTDVSKGYILIENGIFNIISEFDGMQAETKLIIKNGNFDIKTGGGSVNSSNSENWEYRGQYGNQTVNIESAKGIKSQDNLVIENGDFEFDTSDDAIHSNNYVGIKLGNISINSLDDGIHADTELIVDGGTINISKSYEGIESTKITINNGNISIVASDDGINVAGGNDSSSMNRPGSNKFNQSSDNYLIINNGNIYVNSSGDGIDVNGSGYVYGGNTKVDGPVDNGNSALDYDREFIVDDGSFIAAGSSGMLQSIKSSKQYSVIISFMKNYNPNTKVVLLNSNKEIISYSPSKSFSSIIISNEYLKKGETYTIQVDGKDYETFSITNMSTIIGSISNIPGGNMEGPKGPRR